MARKPSRPGPTMIDVARLAGVSQSCVSLVLNEAPEARLSEETRERVRSAARELGYSLARRKVRRERAARTNRGIIAYLVDEVSLSPHPVLHIDGARDAAWEAGLVLQTYVTRGESELEAEVVATIAGDAAVVGMIIATGFTRRIDLPAGLREMPTVLVNCHAEPRRFPALLPGEVAGGATMTQHLLANGHRRIAVVGGEAWMEAAQNRVKGYREALATAGIPVDPDLVREGDWTAASGYRRTLELLALARPPTAVFCANDLMALGCIQAITESGLSVPEDVSVVGYNDLELAPHLHPPLTSCRLPNHELGRRAVEMLLEMAYAERFFRPIVTRLECLLIERASVAPAKVF